MIRTQTSLFDERGEVTEDALFDSELGSPDTAPTRTPVLSEASAMNGDESDLLRSRALAAARAIAAAADLDAGEELAYNRRQRGKAGLQWSEIADANVTLKVKDVRKEKVWPKPDYDELIGAGMPTAAAHLVRQIYDAVSPGPVVPRGAEVGDYHFERYIKALGRLKHAVFEWANSPDDRARYVRDGGTTARDLGLKLFGAAWSAADGMTLEARLEAIGFDADDKAVAGGSKLVPFLRAAAAGPMLARARIAIGKGWPGKRELWETRGMRVGLVEDLTFRPIDNRPEQTAMMMGYSWLKTFTQSEAEEFRSKQYTHVLLDKNRRMLGAFHSRDEAVDAAKASCRVKKRGPVEVVGKAVAEVRRLGPMRRPDDADVTSEMLIAEFGLRGVNFGNWMKTAAARTEAQLHLNHCYDAMHDLAEILGVPPRALGLGGMLGIAIGAQGSGGSAAAHFVPGLNEINITRKTGASCLGHEYGHALDHYLGVQQGHATKDEPFLSEHAVTARGAQGTPSATVSHAMGRTVGAMVYRTETREEHEAVVAAALEQATNRVNRTIDAFRTQYKDLFDDPKRKDQFDAIVERVRARELGSERYVRVDNAHLVGAVLELYEFDRELERRSRVPKNYFSALQYSVNSVERAHNAVEYVARNVPTEFEKNAVQLDKEKGGKQYWSTRREMFARSFDVYLTDALKQRGAENGYLSMGDIAGRSVPSGVERDTITSAIEDLVKHFRAALLHENSSDMSFAEQKEIDAGRRKNAPRP